MGFSFLMCEFYFNVLQTWVVYDTVLGNIPDVISNQNTWDGDWVSYVCLKVISGIGFNSGMDAWANDRVVVMYLMDCSLYIFSEAFFRR